MHVHHVAALTLAACLLSACGFAPPKPPAPPDTPRVRINREDPRITLRGQAAARPVEVARIESPSTAPAGPAENHEIARSIPIPKAPPAQEPTPPAQPAEQAVHAPAPAATGPSDQPPADIPLASTAESAPPVSEPVPIPVAVKEIWRIDPADRTVRQALTRWAAQANWTFGPDQWELNFDLPIQAPAEFQAESFQEATQALSQAIAMTESPVRPCFYANRVLRMVPFARSCGSAALSTLSP
ncbi:MAG: TcpQ domain-containing protein [Achromobacter sp.]|uniref:toxin co-regulated pilus biosynthesis Q family protein n=1 Tax=Achromobacter sp. TaxID=134375 RepID=UPI003D07920C